MFLELDLRDKKNITPILAGDHYEVKINEYGMNILLKLDFQVFDNLADDFRVLCDEKTYTELEEENIFLLAEKEELENEIECLRETNEMLRRL